MPDRTIMITGGSGYLGHHLATTLLETTPHRVVLWQRGESHPLQDNPRVTVATGDLDHPAPFEGVDAGQITDIVHTAAVTRFNVERDMAERVNVEGTARAVEFAHACPRLQSFVLVSSVYSCGLRPGLIGESLHPESPFANHYEWSKARAESLVAASGLPGRIVRTATVLCDDASGQVTQTNAVHNTFKLLYYGLLPLLPGDPQTPVHLTTGEECSQTLIRMLRPDAPRVVQVAAESAMPLGRVLELAYQTFRAEPGFAARRVPRPLLCDLDSFDRLRAAAVGFGGAVLSEAVESIAPFAAQLFAPKHFATTAWRSVWAEASPDPADLLRRACTDLLATRWGKRGRRAA